MENLRELVSMAEGINLFSVVLRIAVSVMCAGILGIERGKANQSAGMRTYILVSLGATVVMLTGQYMFDKFSTGDPARLGAQVISGIGFLGAGSIIVEGKTKVRGLTTAAGLWTAACIGLAVGIGFYLGGIIATAVVYLVITKFKSFSDHFTHNDVILRIYIEFEEMSELKPLFATIESFGLQILDTLLNNPKNSGIYNAVLSIKNPEDKTHEQILDYLKKLQGIKKVRIIY